MKLKIEKKEEEKNNMTDFCSDFEILVFQTFILKPFFLPSVCSKLFIRIRVICVYSINLPINII